MAISDHLYRTNKLRAHIVTVDIERGIVEAIGRDSYTRKITSFETPTIFRWPKVGEEWSIYEQNGDWKLGGRFLDVEERVGINDMKEGELFIDADSIPLVNSLLDYYVLGDGAISGYQIGTISGDNILPGSIPGSVLVPNSIGTALIAPGSITGVQIAGGTITAENIRAYTITANQIMANTITANQIAAGSITANVIAAHSITANEIFAHTITAAIIAAGTITANEIGANTITANKIATGTITANQIAAGTLTATQIAAGTITANQIAANTITAGQIAAGAITAGAIQAGVINSTHIQAYSISAINIAADAITANAIAAGSVTANKISVISLSSLTSNMGSISAGTITGGTVQSAASGPRVVLDTLGIRGYALDGVTKTFEINTGTGQASFTGIAILDPSSIVPTKSLAGFLGGGNQLVDSSFESADPALPYGSFSNISTGATAVKSATFSFDGTKSLRVGWTSGVDPYAQFLSTSSLAPYGLHNKLKGRPLVFSAWVYVPASSGTALGSNPDRSILWYDGTTSGSLDVTTLPRDSWSRISIKFTPSASSTYVDFRLYGSLTGGPVYYDAVQIELGDVATAYAPKPDEILYGSINAVQIQAGSITANEIHSGAITATQLTIAAIDGSGNLTAGSVGNTQLTANSVTTNNIQANTILAANIAAGTITATQIMANTITAAKLSVTSLDAITANVGNLTGGSITGSAIYTGTDINNRVAITSGGITATYGGVQKFSFNTANGAASFTGAITATSGTFTGTISASTINGSTVQTAASGARVVLDSSGLRQYDSGNAVKVEIPSSGADATFTGALAARGVIFQSESTTGMSATPPDLYSIKWSNIYGLARGVFHHYVNAANSNTGLSIMNTNGGSQHTALFLNTEVGGFGGAAFLQVGGVGAAYQKVLYDASGNSDFLQITKGSGSTGHSGTTVATVTMYPGQNYSNQVYVPLPQAASNALVVMSGQTGADSGTIVPYISSQGAGYIYIIANNSAGVNPLVQTDVKVAILWWNP
jgi:hypothetical protein